MLKLGLVKQFECCYNKNIFRAGCDSRPAVQSASLMGMIR